jgi:ribosomal protein S10
MTDRENIKNIIELFIAWNGETEAIDIANLDSAVDFIADSLQEEPVRIWHDSSEIPKEKKVCLIRYSANDGASTNNFEVVIAEPLIRRFVHSYPHKTGYQHTIHGETTIKVDEYQDRREKIPFSDIDEWAYIDDLLNINL